MSNIADIINDLKSEGELDSQGAFSLDRSKAREKMKKYQLVEPHYYVLEIMQAAAAGGASKINVEVDSDDCIITFDGEHYTREDLENLYSSLFMSQSDMRLERYRELAIGINSALALNPKFIRLISGNGVESTEFLVIPPGEERIFPSAEIIKGTKIHVKEKLTLRVAKKFLRRFGAFKMPHEGELIMERCRYGAVPVYVNQILVNNEQDRRLEDAVCQISFKNDKISGIMGLPSFSSKISHITFLKWGVLINSRRLRLSNLPISTVVESNMLIKNVSQSDIVENEQFRETISLLKQEQVQLHIHLAELLTERKAVLDNSSKKVTVSNVLNITESDKKIMNDNSIQTHMLDSLMQIIEMEFNVNKYTRKPTKLLRKLAQPKIFMTTLGEWINLDELCKQLDKIGFLPYSQKMFKDPHPDNLTVVYVGEQQQLNLLDKIFANQKRNVEQDFYRIHLRSVNKKKWEENKGQPIGFSFGVSCSTDIKDGHITGKAGIVLRSPDKFSRIGFYKENSLIAEKNIELDGLFIDALINNDLITPGFTWDEVEYDQEYIKSLEVLLKGLPPLFIELMEIYKHINDSNKGIIGIHLLRYINFVLGSKSHDADSHDFPSQLEGKAKDTEAKGTNIDEQKPRAGFLMSRTGPASSSVSFSKRTDLTSIEIKRPDLVLPQAFQELQLFSTANDQLVSLKELKEEQEKHGKVFYFIKKMSGKQMEDKTIVIAGSVELSILVRYFGKDKLENYEKAFIQYQEALGNMNRPKEKAAIGHGVVLKVPIKHKGITGEIGITHVDYVASGQSYKQKNNKREPSFSVIARILKDYRFVVNKSIKLPLPSLAVVVNYDDINVTMGRNDVFEDERFDELITAIKNAAAELALKVLDELPQLSGAGSFKARWYLLEYYGYHFSNAASIEDTSPLTVKLKEFPMFKTTKQGEGVSLKQLFEQKTAYGKIPYVNEEISYGLDNERTVLYLTLREIDVLSSILGSDCFEDVASVLLEKQKVDYIRKMKPTKEAKIITKTPLFKVSVENPDMTGEIGFPHYTDSGWGTFSSIQILKESRFIIKKEVLMPLNVIGCINYDKINVNDSWTAVKEDKQYEELMNEVRRSIYRLIEQVFDNYDNLDKFHKPEVNRYFVSFFFNSFKDYKDILKFKSDSFMYRLSRLPIFSILGGEKAGILDLIEYHTEKDRIDYVCQDTGIIPLDAEKKVFVIPPDLAAFLSKKMKNLCDYSNYLMQDAIAWENMKKEPIKEIKVSEDSIVTYSFNRKQMKGELALHKNIEAKKGILFSKKMIPIIEKSLYPTSKVFGIIESPELKTNRTYDDVTILQNDARIILDIIEKLYKKLADNYPLMDDPVIKDTARIYLLDFYIDQKNYVESKYRTMGKELEETIVDLPLLPIIDGRFVGISALQSQLDELGYTPFLLTHEQPLLPSDNIIFKFDMFSSDYDIFNKLCGSVRLKNYNSLCKLKKASEKQQTYWNELEEKNRNAKVELKRIQEAKEAKLKGLREEMEEASLFSPMESKAQLLLKQDNKEKGDPAKRLLFSMKREREIAGGVNNYQLSQDGLKNLNEAAADGSEELIGSAANSQLTRDEEIRLNPQLNLLYSIKREFRIIREFKSYKLSEYVLKNMRVQEVPDKSAIIFNRKKLLLTVNIKHPLVSVIMQKLDTEPHLLYYLISIIYSTINRELEEITDEDEIKFQRIMLENLSKQLEAKL